MPSKEGGNQIRLNEAVLILDTVSFSILKTRDDLQPKPSYVINGVIINEIIQGAVDPSIGSVAPLNSKLFYNTTTNTISRANESGLWVAITGGSITNVLSNPANGITSTVNGVASTLTPSTGVLATTLGFNAAGVLVKQATTETIVDFSVNANPNTAGTIFSPSTPTNPDVVYHSIIDDTAWIWNGVAYVPLVPTGKDFWRSGVGAITLPDGVSDITENIRRNGFVGLNIDPTSTFDDNGSFALASTNVATGNYTAAITDSVIYLNSATTQTLTLPAASGVNRRIYTIANPSAIDKPSSSYLGLDGTALTIIPAKSVVTLQSDGTSWKTIGFDTSAGVSSVPVIVAKGRVDIGNPVPTGARTVTNSINIASATGLDTNATDARVQINFTTALSSADYIISGELVSQNATNWNNDNEIFWMVVSKSTTGFVIATKEITSATQSLFFDFQIHQAGVNTSTAYVAGTGITITGNTIAAGPSVLGGNIIAIGEKYPSLTEITFGNLKMRWNAPSDRFEIATVTGTETLEWTTMTMYGAQSATINGGGGMDGTTQGTPINATTTFQVVGDAGLLGVENRTYNIWTNTGKHYRVNVLRKGTTTTDGWVTFIVEEIGVTTTQIYTAGTGINITGNVITRPYQSGETIQTKVYRNAAVAGTTAAFSAANQFNPTTTFTPKSTSSTIVITFDMDYSISGYGQDVFQILLREGTTTLFEKRQSFNNNAGAGTRSTVMLPITGSYDNTTLTAKSFNVLITRTVGDDSVTVFTQRNVVITEIQN